MVRIAIIAGSTRPGRRALEVARWVHRVASRRDDATFEIVDLLDFALPLFDEPAPPALAAPTRAHTERWASVVGAFDGYVFVSGEYNHGAPAALKNAIDFLYREWNDKAAGLVTYGVHAGTRAADQLRLVAGELQMATVQKEVSLSLFADLAPADGANVGAPGPRREAELAGMLDQLVRWAGALATVRDAGRARPAGPGGAPARPVVGLARDRAPVDDFVRGLQDALDRGDAALFNRQFAADVLWGSPFGAVIEGYDRIHDIHRRMFGATTPAPGASRYVVEHVRFPSADVALAHVRRLRAASGGAPSPGQAASFDELALFVLARRDGRWWVAAGQHVPDRRDL